MLETTQLACRCGAVRLETSGKPIVTAECCCTSCRQAGQRFDSLTGVPAFRTPQGTTPYVLQRKDRVRFTAGTQHQREFRLTPQSPTRRVVATCCNTPVFVEFKGGHWLSLYASLWPEQARPAMAMRTMTADLPAGIELPPGVASGKRQSGLFFAKLLGAWIAMGFRVPRVETAGELRLQRRSGVNHTGISTSQRKLSLSAPC